MKRRELKLLMLSFAMAMTLAACGGAASGENTAPVISGVQDIFIEAGKEFDAFAGVSANDAEDGDECKNCCGGNPFTGL